MNKKQAYSNLKFLHHLERIKLLEKGGSPPPVFVQWDISNVCNLDCSFCFYKIYPKANLLSDWDEKASMPTKLIIKTLKDLKNIGVKAIEWTGGGSVECHLDYKKILKRSGELGFENALVTNGTLLDDEAIKLIKDFEWVRFSIDAATKETYKRIKRRDLFDKAINNLKKLIKIKKLNNVLGFSFIICPENYQEIYSAGLLAKQLKCDNVRFSLAHTPKKDKIFENIWDEIIRQIKMVKALEKDEFRVFSFEDRLEDLAGKRFSKFCAFHHFCAVISPTGMYPCCTLKDMGEFNFGDLNKKSFAEIWWGDKRKKFIESIKDGCPFACWMTEKNRIVEYLMEKNPKHVNFI